MCIRDSKSERDGLYSELNEKPTAKTAITPKDDYYRDYHRDRESVSSTRKHIQINDKQPSTLSSRERFQQRNEKQPVMSHDRKPQTGLDNRNSTRKAEDGPQMSERESSFSLQKMKEDLLRDQAKLDRQLMANTVVGDGRSTPRFDNQQRYDGGRSSDMYDTDFRRLSYATDEHMVCFLFTLFFYFTINSIV